MTVYKRNLNKADIKDFMTKNYGTDSYDDFYKAIYNLKVLTLISDDLWNYISKLDKELFNK